MRVRSVSLGVSTEVCIVGYLVLFNVVCLLRLGVCLCSGCCAFCLICDDCGLRWSWIGSIFVL